MVWAEGLGLETPNIDELPEPLNLRLWVGDLRDLDS